MKRSYYVLMVLMAFSPCYGVPEKAKHCAAGIGKTLLGAFCVYNVANVLFREYPARNSLTGQKTTVNALLSDAEDTATMIANGLLVLKNDDSWQLATPVYYFQSSLALLGLSSYGAYKSFASAKESFKKAFSKEQPHNQSEQKKEVTSSESKGEENLKEDSQG